MNNDADASFQRELQDAIPGLRSHAIALMRGNRDRANDLLHATLLKALAERSKFTPGTNLAAWTHRIQRNVFIDDLRRQRRTEPIDDVAPSILACRPTQESALLMKEFLRAFAQLPNTQREALVLSVIEGLSYEQIADRLGVATGTVKSRVCRGRDNLAALMRSEGDEGRTSPRRSRSVLDREVHRMNAD
jgi:RNA polymerase sigma-70 factor (ECF subfamily)